MGCEAPMVRAVAVLVGLGLAACRVEGEAALGRADAVVVLGHRPPLDACGIEYETRARVERGVALFQEGRAPRLLFSGGESTEGVVEAEVMAAHARRLGVPEEAILREGESLDTIENARLSVRLLQARSAHRAPRVLLVTSDYHLGRAVHLFRCAGALVEGAGVPLEDAWRKRARRKLRELGVRLGYWFIDECERARADAQVGSAE